MVAVEFSKTHCPEGADQGFEISAWGVLFAAKIFVVPMGRSIFREHHLNTDWAHPKTRSICCELLLLHIPTFEAQAF